MNDLRRSLLKGMANIVTDLYGEPVPAAKTATLKSADSPVPAKLPELPPFVRLWRTADESIDWTDIVASPTPTDGLTSPEKWAMYHQYAAAILKGDMTAYLTILQSANPMDDLTPYVAALDVATVSPDLLSAHFSVRPDLMKGDAQEYICGMAVRIARDLFAALPVLEVSVCSMQDGKKLLTVAFKRSEMNKVRFTFIDPVEFVKECGGEFTEVMHG